MRVWSCLTHLAPVMGAELVRNLAVAMYAEGNSIEAISRLLGMKAGTVYSWVKKAFCSETP